MCCILFRWRKASKCKDLVRRVQCRLKFLKIKRRSILKQLHEDIVDLLKNGQPETAFSHAEELLKDQNLLAAYDLLEHFCEFIIVHLPYIRKHKNCPNDINEAVSTLIFAAAWCGDLPELETIRKLFKERYGSKFIKAITELHPGNHVNSQVKEKLCLKSFPDDMKLSLIVELAKDHAFQPQHPGSNKRLGSTVLLICRNDNLHWEGFLFEGIFQGDYGSSCLARMLPTTDEDIQAKLPGQMIEVGNSVQVEHRYETEMVCKKLSDKGSSESFCSNHSSTTTFGNKVETRRTSSQSEFLVQFNKRTFNLEEVEEIHINTLPHHYAGDKTLFLFTSTLLPERNNGFSEARLLVSSHCCIETNIFPHQSYPRSMTIGPERVKKTTTDCSLPSDSCKQFQNSKGINSSSCRHVHPKLPDYDELVAKFKALKQEHQQRGAACCKAIKS